MSRGHDLRTLGDLTNHHMGRTITIRDLTGRLDGLTPDCHNDQQREEWP